MTSKKLHKLFRRFNRLCFNDSLPKPVIVWVALPYGHLGFCDEVRPGKYKIWLNNTMDLPTTEATLVHEMIHMHQFETGQPTDHNKEFRKWAHHCKKLLGYSVL